MRTFYTFAVALLLSGATSLLVFSNGNIVAQGLCDEITDPNVSCREQYNSHSNVETTTSTTTDEEEEEIGGNPLLCSDLKCTFGKEYIIDHNTDISDPLDLLDY
ncbi:hypothetical protein [Candidatus Nitrosocosmicus franklandus]|uniref:Uncharacterized protein n=1 Tax=Candidatus Nitrosocosmicus franklandianus TaxID=1798806 RepID=A0A484ICE9_9ARCH|nr:hypothetical protein [Candidatus Nitrosocosmicus franklandus]VFJ12691.1 conserved exported protein of unknown function [Candidatus Nitrosocosmicus franklandus]